MRDYTDVTMILDRSGSMFSIREATVAGMNKFIREQDELPGAGCYSLVQFDDQYDVVYSAKEKAPLLTQETFVPRGTTALIHAVCKTIDDTGARLAALPDHLRPNRVLIVIMTDGCHNTDVPGYTKEGMNNRIAEQREKYRWQFVFAGANQDAVATAASYGIPTFAAMTYSPTPAGTAAFFGGLSGSNRAWKLDGNESAKDFILDPKPEVKVEVAITTGSK